MTAILELKDIQPADRSRVGGKACKLAALHQAGLNVPTAVCISTEAYLRFVRETGLDQRIALELNRMDPAERRWEEIWDVSLRIRNQFLKTPMPTRLEQEITGQLSRHFAAIPVAVRSSAPHEDSSSASFAGLHKSYINITGLDQMIRHVRLVWASLWSDGAIMYRNELGIQPQTDAMGVVVQELVIGNASGVCFTVSPAQAGQMAIEAVYGLNEGLVDGSIEPDRWLLNRSNGEVQSHLQPSQREAMRPHDGATQKVSLNDTERIMPPLTAENLQQVFEAGMLLEQLFGAPQDLEWTLRGDNLFLLQSRDITTGKPEQSTGPLWKADDKRLWYQTLTRSFESLSSLHLLIRDELLPQMNREADELAKVPLDDMNDAQLAEEIKRRDQVLQHWVEVYWEHLIPFAHGARLFGEVYNDMMQPEDPYSFTRLLKHTGMNSLRRNERLIELAATIRSRPALAEILKNNSEAHSDAMFENELTSFLSDYDEHTFKNRRFFNDRSGLIGYLLEMASHEELFTGHDDVPLQQHIDDFIKSFPKSRRTFARDILEIGRASYQLRDDDNIILARIEAKLLDAVDRAKSRLLQHGLFVNAELPPKDIARMLINRDSIEVKEKTAYVPDEPIEHKATPDLILRRPDIEDERIRVTARQMIGQPAGPGLAIGPARVIVGPDDLFSFKSGEILVCDSIDPNMTFIVPLAAAIVERRGGMLVHGAIIAREYGLPCITGVTDATTFIQTGNKLTVDGYQGVVTIHSK